MGALDRVKISGFKSIRELDLELGALNVLIGANGAGKSNFIQTFELLNVIMDERLQVFVARAGGANNLLHFGRKSTDKIQISLVMSQYRYAITLAAAEDDSLFLADEQIALWGNNQRTELYHEQLGSGHKETALPGAAQHHQTYSAEYDRVIRNIHSWKLYQFHDTSDSARVKQTGNIDDNAFLRPDAGNLAAFLYMLRETQRPHYDQIVRTIRLVAPFFDDFNLRPSPLNPDKIRLEWRERGSDAYFNASMLSDGTLRFMCLATLLLQPDLPATILIDEPELGLHPYAITILTSLLQSAAVQTQVIVATQSVPLVNQFTPDDVLVVDRAEGQSTFKRLQTEEIAAWMDDYGLGDLWEKNVIGGRPQR